ncbi:MAG: hypothetical protein Q4A16_08165, partial [Lautropia sp.]|nr:hypothetical protein [Lautropia sp.]
MKKYITLAAFFLGQGLTGTVISLLTLTSALVGKQLAPVPSLATLPITMTVLGSLVMSYGGLKSQVQHVIGHGCRGS